MTLAFTLLGALGFLYLGAESLIRGASRLALWFKISPLVIGLTVVAYGTSTPELSVNVLAVLRGNLDIAVGNVVGSNIVNVFLILGLSALIAPLIVHQQIVRIDVPIMIGSSILLWILALDRRLTFFDGLILIFGIVLYSVFLIRMSRRETKAIQEEYREAVQSQGRPHRGNLWLSILLVLLGLGLLIQGSQWLVEAAIILARRMEISEMVIGLTVVAIGTSLPEIITSVLATIRGQKDIAVGNVVGSNIYNILAILGVSSVMAADGVPISEPTLGFDIPVMIGAALACLPICFTGHRISRWEGLLFLGCFAAYNIYLIFNATAHDQLGLFNKVLLSFVLPLIFVTILIAFIRALAAQTGKRAGPS